MSIVQKIAAKPLALFVTKSCPFCNAARRLAQDRHVDAEVVVLDHDKKSLRQELTGLTGQTTVPYVFSRSKFIGGYTELSKQPQSFWDAIASKSG